MQLKVRVAVERLPHGQFARCQLAVQLDVVGARERCEHRSHIKGAAGIGQFPS
jgi:hypothetical protein